MGRGKESGVGWGGGAVVADAMVRCAVLGR
jgi:hypothetical protein